MAVPDYQTCLLPFLRSLLDGNEHTLHDAEENLAGHFELTPAARAEHLPSGQQGIFLNRIGWARTYQKKALLLEPPNRGAFRFIERGVKTLASIPTAAPIAPTRPKRNYVLSSNNESPLQPLRP